jgi:hypothetical protein
MTPPLYVFVLVGVPGDAVDRLSVNSTPHWPGPRPRDPGEREEKGQTPLLFPSASLHTPDRRELARARLQCPDAMTSPRQHAPKAAAPGVDVASRRTPTFGTPPLQRAPAYKTPLRARHRTHTIPSNLLDNLSSLCSLSFVVASTAGELLDAVGATAFGHRWKNGRREVEEKSRRNLFRPALSSSSSPTSLAVAALFPAAAGESLDEPDGNDADAPLDSHPTAAYRFGLLK